MTDFLPMTKDDMAKRGWEQLDFLFISGDAYVDHPSFGPAIICRLLEKHGYKVGIIAQPDWRSTTEFKRLGKPRLGILVSAGNLDSMLNKFTAAKKYRSTDNYSPGGQAGLRPERATIVYCNRIREIWKHTPLIIGGIEASLRRFAHYDYWSDNVRRSILIDSRADMLIYGMGENQIKELADQLAAGIPVNAIRDIPGTCYPTESIEHLWDYVETPSYQDVSTNKQMFAEAFKTQYLEQDPIRGKTIVQEHGGQYVVQNPPAMPLTTTAMDEIYDLPYERTYHPSYIMARGIPAIQEVKFSIISHRGCYGSCSFCALYAHQGRIIQSRSQESIIKEAGQIVKLPDFKGYIHDVGGPTANFRHPACEQQADRGTCRGKQCLFPNACKNLNTDHHEYLELLRAIRKVPGIKKVFVRSGLRYDYLLAANDKEFLRELCEHHVSGQLKIAPEHISPKVTKLMGKAGKDIYVKFKKLYGEVNEKLGKKQYLVPYFMSSHPGSSLKEAVEVAEFLRDSGDRPEQVQDFIPTPGSLSTCMYYTGMHPLTGEKVYVAKTPYDKSLQRALLQYRDPKNYKLVYEALIKADRKDLIGYEPKCLIRPPRDKQPMETKRQGESKNKNRRLISSRNKEQKKKTR
ncbi:MAG: putative radical protein YgiQ [Firmicutes bacterium]|nr:putative radical protein YgiQ [Bacillota bacterium]